MKETLSADDMNALKKVAVEKLAETPLLPQLPPWSALDVYAALAGTHPDEGRREFAEKNLLGSKAYQIVLQDCPVLAQYYQDRVAEMPSATTQNKAAPDAQSPSAP